MMLLMHDMIDQMDTMQMADDPEIDFATMMIMHHHGAINMANLELQQGKNDALKNMAQMMTIDQQMEIDELNAYLAANTVDNSVPAFTSESEMAMDKMDANADLQIK